MRDRAPRQGRHRREAGGGYSWQATQALQQLGVECREPRARVAELAAVHVDEQHALVFKTHGIDAPEILEGPSRTGRPRPAALPTATLVQRPGPVRAIVDAQAIRLEVAARVSTGASLLDRNAGAMPNSRLVAIATTAVKTNTRPSGARSRTRGLPLPLDSIATRDRLATCAIPTPTTAPIEASKASPSAADGRCVRVLRRPPDERPSPGFETKLSRAAASRR